MLDGLYFHPSGTSSFDYLGILVPWPRWRLPDTYILTDRVLVRAFIQHKIVMSRIYCIMLFVVSATRVIIFVVRRQTWNLALCHYLFTICIIFGRLLSPRIFLVEAFVLEFPCVFLYSLWFIWYNVYFRCTSVNFGLLYERLHWCSFVLWKPQYYRNSNAFNIMALFNFSRQRIHGEQCVYCFEGRRTDLSRNMGFRTALDCKV